MGKGVPKADACVESPRSKSGSEARAPAPSELSTQRPRKPARWPLGLSFVAWLVWVGFLVAMLMAQSGGAGSS